MAPQVFRHSGFRITSNSAPILKAGPIDAMTTALGIAPPEMIFGDNFVRIEHESSGWGIEYNAFDALDLVDKTGEKMLSVAYGEEWQESRYGKELCLGGGFAGERGCSMADLLWGVKEEEGGHG